MELGTLAAIHRYPVKSLRGESLDDVAVLQHGLDGDRVRSMIVREGHARTGKPYRGKENDRLHLSSDPQSGIESARERGVTVELEERDGEPYFDDAPVSLIVDTWLRGLSAYLGYDVEYTRFRPNFFVRARARFSLTEEAMTGRELALGEVLLRVRYPIERCVVTTYDPNGGESDPEILSYVARERSAWMGIYCDVLRAGIVRIGDSFPLVER
jgi:MOSC domain-containing protein